MTVIFQSHHQFEFCDKILRGVTEDDGDSLMVATSSQEISLASLKVLQILSPLLTEIVKTLPLTYIPLKLIVPDTDANTWKALMSLLTQGKVEVSLAWGYNLCWGCLTWVQIFYTFSAYFLVSQPSLLSSPGSGVILMFGLTSLGLNYWADYQKEKFKVSIFGSDRSPRSADLGYLFVYSPLLLDDF